MKKRVMGYARVSTEKQDLERQILLIKEYCRKQSYLLVDIISEKVSGAKKDRESINRLREVDNDTADMVVVSELSRLSREKDIMNLLSLVNDLLENGLDVLFLDNPNKIYSAFSELSLIDIITLSVEAHAAAEERKKIATRMSTGIYTKFQMNPYIYTGGGAVPFGYKVIDNPVYDGQAANKPPKKLLEVNSKEMNIVKLVYNLVLEGNTCRDTAKKLTDMGYKTKHGYLFTENTISKIIRNPIYNGRRTYKDITLNIEKVISDYDWNLATKKLNENQIVKGKYSINYNPLKGIAYCPCGHSLMIHKTSRQSRQGEPYYMLECTHQKRKVNIVKCENIGIELNLLFNSVWHVLKHTLRISEYAVKSNAQKEKEKEIINQLEEQVYNLTCEQDSLKKELVRLERAIAYVENIELVKRYEAQYVAVSDKINELENRKDNIHVEISTHEDNIQKLSTIEKEEAFNSFTDKDKSDLCRKVLNKVVYYSITTYRGFIIMDYANGMKSILAVKKGKRGYVALLPFSFDFNENDRTVLVKTDDKEDGSTTGFNFSIKTVSYKFEELEKVFPLEEWQIGMK